MIKSVHIENFKNIRNQTIDLERLTVFVGPNGCGKTSVLQAVEMAVTGKLPTVSNSIKPNITMESIYSRDGMGDFLIKCETKEGTFTHRTSPHPAASGVWQRTDGPTENDEHGIIRKSVQSICFLNLNFSRVAEPWYSDRSHPRIEPDGGGTSSALAFMALNDPDSYLKYLEYLKEMFPRLIRIRFDRVLVQHYEYEHFSFNGSSTQLVRKDRAYQGDAMLFDFENAKGIEAFTLSEGTLIIVGLLAVLLGPDRPKTLLIDDLDHRLHPLAQSELLKLIKKIMDRFPELQILATTHSPYLLDHLEPQEIRLMTTNSDGHAICGRLDDHSEFERWKDEMAPGEMWSLFGEKWLLDKGEVR